MLFSMLGCDGNKEKTGCDSNIDCDIEDVCDIKSGECVANPCYLHNIICSNHGTCKVVDNVDSDDYLEAYCECEHHYNNKNLNCLPDCSVSSICNNNAFECDDSSGEVICNCPENYFQDKNYQCVSPCDESSCKENEKCISTSATEFECSCINNYFKDGSENCVSPCSEHETCEGKGTCIANSLTEANCICNDQYQDNDNNLTCELSCNSNGVCSGDKVIGCNDITGLAICSCNDGYFQNEDYQCVSPCNENSCGVHEICIANPLTEFTCNCSEGYINNNGNCIEDLCSSSNCNEWEECNVLNGECDLKENRCNTIDDCNNVLELCSDEHSCYNPCDGVNCSGNGTCVRADVNAPIMCICDRGYVADGLECINPCENQYCSGHGVCEVVSDNAVCTCDPGYSENGLQCIENTGWDKIAIGYGHICGITEGKLYCWGKNDKGQLGLGNNINYKTPQRIGILSNWNDIATGSSFTCGIESAKLYCWGENNEGQLGINNLVNKNTPQLVGNLTDWNKVSLGERHSCAISGGALYCWGDNGYGRLGINENGGTYKTPQRVTYSNYSDWFNISLGGSHTCARRTNGRIYCWGNNGYGQLGIGNNNNQNLPKRIGWDLWNTISSGYMFSCAIKNDDKLYCWGDNENQNLGNSGNNTNEPIIVGSYYNWSHISTGYFHACGITENDIYCWGYNGEGQLGINQTYSTQTSPKKIDTPNLNWNNIVLNGLNSCAISENGDLYCWGDNSYGQLGNNTNINENSPILVEINE